MSASPASSTPASSDFPRSQREVPFPVLLQEILLLLYIFISHHSQPMGHPGAYNQMLSITQHKCKQLEKYKQPPHWKQSCWRSSIFTWWQKVASDRAWQISKGREFHRSGACTEKPVLLGAHQPSLTDRWRHQESLSSGSQHMRRLITVLQASRSQMV